MKESTAAKLKIRFVKRSSRSDHESLAAGSVVQSHAERLATELKEAATAAKKLLK